MRILFKETGYKLKQMLYVIFVEYLKNSLASEIVSLNIFDIQ